jgi:hypothetical protein
LAILYAKLQWIVTTGAFGSAMMSPSTLVPIALGEGKREELRMQDEMDALGRQERQKKDKKI